MGFTDSLSFILTSKINMTKIKFVSRSMSRQNWIPACAEMMRVVFILNGSKAGVSGCHEF